MSPRIALALLLAASACMPARYREEPPPEDRARAAAAGRDAAAGGAEGATVVGHVTPDGTLVADTLARSMPDTARVERETVVTGEIRAAAELETERAQSGAETAAVLATGWRVQVYATRAQPEAAAEASRVRDALGGGASVYVERDEPWYKVRVGDYADRAAADGLRERLAGLGWPEAWTVRATIRTAP